MNPIDKAFMSAYAKTRPMPPAGLNRPAVESSPISEPSAAKALRVDKPIDSNQVSTPHLPAGSVVPTAVRSPSVVMPSATKVDSNDQQRVHLRIDRVNQAPPSVPASKLNSAPAQRRTLTSYLQQSRQPPSPTMDNLAQLSKTPAPRTIPADQQKPATPSVSPSAPVASTVVKLPAAATRWSAPIHVAPPVQRVDAPHEINPPVHRPEALQTWAGQTVERSVKSTASFQSVPAKTVNPASMEANSVGPFSDDPFAAIAFETIVTSTINPPTHRLANGGFKPHFSQETPQPAAPESRRTPESTPSDIIDFQIPGVDARVKHSHFGNIATTNVPASTVRAPEASPLAANPSSTSNVFEKFNFRTGLSEQARNEASKPVVPIQPMWEVDSFFWPATVENLLSTQVEAFDEIGLHFQRMQSAGLRILSVTSGERGVGRSTVAMCLAKAVAKTGLKVALVDGDYETPSLIDQLNMAVDYGWQECISSNIPLDEVVVHSIEDGLALVPLTDSIAGSIVNEQLPRINKLIKRLSGAYDFVVIDGNRLTQKHPRLIGTGEEAVLDAALVIVDAELSLRQRVDTAVDLIREQGVKSIGLAENFHSEAIA